ncbi:MAG TPA: hypothetical protein VM307_12250 [Egibacteraceae bacterium]|nr:hypothetical protein [Egibacteraceae bacterium]
MQRISEGRRLLAALILSAAVFAVTAVVAPSLNAGTAVRAGPPGSVIPQWIGATPVWVATQRDGRTTVVEALNPRLWMGMTERVGWCESQGQFIAFYDASRFDIEGGYAFGPAPTGLARFPVLSRSGDSVRVGPRVASTSRSSDLPERHANEWTACWTDPSGVSMRRPVGTPAAVFHDAVTPGTQVVDGTVVVAPGGAFYCEGPATLEPPRCGGRSVPLPDVTEPLFDDQAVAVHGRFRVRRSSRGFHDVTVLPDGWTEFSADG